MGDESKAIHAVGTVGKPSCPKCGKALAWVGSGPGWMNSEQWDASKAGEYFAAECGLPLPEPCVGRSHTNGKFYFDEIARSALSPDDGTMVAVSKGDVSVLLDWMCRDWQDDASLAIMSTGQEMHVGGAERITAVIEKLRLALLGKAGGA